MTGALVLAAALGSAVRLGRVDRCDEEVDPLGGIWDRQRRAQLAAVVGSSEQALHDLDSYAESWRVTRRTSCEATWLRGEQSQQLLDRSMQCLDRARVALQALLVRMEVPDRRWTVTPEEMVSTSVSPAVRAAAPTSNCAARRSIGQSAEYFFVTAGACSRSVSFTASRRARRSIIAW